MPMLGISSTSANPETKAAWLQALAAVLQAGVAVGLFVITKRYVELTARLAASSEAQVQLMRADRELMRAEKNQRQQATVEQFRQVARMLLGRLQQLPGRGPEARQAADRLFRGAVLPSEAELKELVDLATAIGPSLGEVARAASDNYRWMSQIARPIQATRPEQGFNYDSLNWNLWVFYYIETENALTKLASS
jgi:hypothetical protein